jgi:hypothetical protein
MSIHRLQSVFVPAIAIIVISCSWPARRVDVGEKFAMRPKEEVTLADTGITIRLNEVGHQTFSGPTPSRRAAAYAVFAVSTPSGSRTVRLDVGEDEQVGDYLIKLNSANPFNSDNGPRCELTVTKK